MKYPFVKQIGYKDCAVATLSMIIRYYKGYISSDQLRDMLETNRGGTSALNIIKVAEYLGFQTKAIKTKNLNNIKLPCIAYVTVESKMRHFVVIYEIDLKKGTILIADPASRIKKMKIEEFNLISNNIFILFFKIKQIPYLKDYSIIKFIYNLIAQNKKTVFKISSISFFVNILIIFISFTFNILSSSINYDYRLKYIFLIIIITFAVLKVLSTYLRNLLTIHLDKKMSYELKTEFFEKIIHFPYIYYANRTTGEIVSRVSDLDIVKSFISKIIIILFSNIPLILISLIVMFSLSLKLTIYTLLFLLLYIVIVLLFIKPFKNRIQEYKNSHEENTNFLIESLSSYECVKGNSIEGNINSKYKTMHYKFTNLVLNFAKTYNLENLFKDLISELSIVLVIFIGITEIENSLMNIGSLITFTFLFSNFTGPIKDIFDSSFEFEESLNALKRVLELNYKVKSNGLIKEITKTDIVVKNLNYSYDEEVILKDVNLNIKEGEKVIVVGESGCGKSTLMKILKNYLEIKPNMVSIGSCDLKDYSNESFKSISYIGQTEMLFTDTIYRNIDLYRNINENKVLELAKLCFVDEFAKRNDLGYNMLIEENGFNLSGGEKQRIVLARTLLSNSKIILIDEGTNQLDVSLERKILKRIFEKFKEKTIIVVSHRVDNFDLFDHFIKLEGGRIVEDELFGK